MKTRLISLSAAAILAAAATQASAQLLYEPFNYPPGVTPPPANTLLDGQVNPSMGSPWARVGSSTVNTDQMYLNNTPFDYSTGPLLGLPTSYGNNIAYHGTVNGVSERLSLGPVVSSGTEYYSMAFKITALSSLPTTQIYVAGFSSLAGAQSNSPTVAGARIHVARVSTSDSTAFVIGLTKNSSSQGDVQWEGGSEGAVVHHVGDPIFIVAAYNINTAGATDDSADMWIDPSSSTFGAASAPTPTITADEASNDLNNGGVPSVASLMLRTNNTNVPFIVADDIRVDSTWAGVTPQASARYGYNAAGSGSWSTGTNWTDNTGATGVAPNAINDVAVFGDGTTSGAIAAGSTITVDGGGQTVGGIELNNAGALTIAGGPLNISTNASAGDFVDRLGSHTISANIATPAPIELQIYNAADTLTISGNIDGGGTQLVTKYGLGTAALTGANNIAGVASYAGKLVLGSSSVYSTGLTASGTTTVQIAHSAGNNLVINANAISVNGGAQLDLTNNKLITNSAVGSFNGTSYTGVTGLVASGRNGGTWNGPGIITSETQASTSILTTLGVATGAQAKGLAPGATAVWAGQTISDTSTLVMYTYAGDANLDGRINGDDYFAIDSHVNSAGASGYANGDFNYDGRINGDDYFIIDSNINQQSLGVFSTSAGVSSAHLSGVSAVPEPASIGLLGIAGLGLMRRRRRSR